MKSILLQTHEVRGILSSKADIVLKRAIKLPEERLIRQCGTLDGSKYGVELDNGDVMVAPYQPGDMLYGRETWNYGYFE